MLDSQDLVSSFPIFSLLLHITYFCPALWDSSLNSVFNSVSTFYFAYIFNVQKLHLDVWMFLFFFLIVSCSCVMNVLSLWGDHCFFNQFYWDIITFNKLHPFKVYNSKSFDSCSHTCETPNTRYRLFQPHFETSYAMCNPSFSLSLALVIFFVIIDLFAFSRILYNWNYTECILCVWLFFTQCNNFEIHSHCFVYQ